MARKYSSQVLFYLAKQSFSFINSGLAALAGVVRINGTDIVVSDMAVAATIETAINTELGAGTVSVSLATETFTVLFNYGTYNKMRVWIFTAEVVVTDITVPTADLKIAAQTNLDVERAITLVDVTTKDSNGADEKEPTQKVMNVNNENVYMSDDANYQLLRDAWKNGLHIFAFAKLASGDFWMKAVIENLSESAQEADMVRASITWHSSGNWTEV